MKRRLLSLSGAAGLTLAVGLAFSGAAGAALIDRGGGLIYDNVLDITWLQDANYAFNSGFTSANEVNNGTSATDNIFNDGRMGWDAAVAWAAGLEFFDSVRNVTWDDWRLPLTLQPDSSCSGQLGGTPLQGFGLGCTGSEMGHLFNVDGISAGSPGPFTNVQLDFYWSASEFAPDPSGAWNLFLENGGQSAFFKDNEWYAWAVRPGDVAAQSVPEPATAALLGAALGLLGWRGRARRHSMIRSFG